MQPTPNASARALVSFATLTLPRYQPLLHVCVRPASGSLPYSRSYRQKTELEPWLIDPMRELGVMPYFKRAVEVFAEKYAEK